MEEMKAFLHDAALANYVDIFEEKGYDSLEHLLHMGPQDVLELKRLTKMKDGHFARFQSTMEAWRPPTTYTPPTSVGPAETGPAEMGPAAATGPDAMGPMGPTGPDAMGPMGPTGPTVPMVPMIPLGPNHPDICPKTASSLKASLRQAYTTWTQARLVSLNYSTQLGCSAILDNKKSGGRRKVLRCRTALSKKKRNINADADAICPHMLLWTKNRTGDWNLNWGKSILDHKPFCNSGQIVSTFQLVNDPEFVKSQNLGKLSTGKEAAKLALGSDGRLDGSVQDYTARRARDTIKHYGDLDYDDDWSKLNQWGHKFMELNPQGMFDLQKDDEGRLVIACLMGPIACIGPKC